MKFDERFPHIAEWVETTGWIEVGQFDYPRNPNFICALNEGGVVWEGGGQYDSVDAAFQEMDAALAEWLKENS